MKKSHGRQWDPTVDLYGHGFWGVFVAWAERRSIQGCPKSLRMPEDSLRWERQGRALVGTPGYSSSRSTAPKEPTRLDEMGMAFGKLNESQGAMLIECVEMEAEPWLNGDAWRAKLRMRRMGPQRYEQLVRLAWRRLTSEYRARRDGDTADHAEAAAGGESVNTQQQSPPGVLVGWKSICAALGGISWDAARGLELNAGLPVKRPSPGMVMLWLDDLENWRKGQ